MSKNKWIFIIGGVVAVIAIVLAVIFCLPGEDKRVSLRDYVSVTEEGLDGHGSITVDVKSSDDEIAQKLVQSLEVKYQLPEGKTNGLLSNGDVATITVEYDVELAKELNLTVQDASFEYTVSKLEAVAQFDVLSHFDLRTEGYDGYGGVWVEAPESAEFQVGNVTFRLVKGYGRVEWEDKDGDSGTFYIEINYAPKSACNGDVVKAAITVPADHFLLDGVMLTGVEREYTVDGLQESVEVDFLSYYDISFTGPDGYGEIVITPKQEKVTIGTFEVDLTTGAWSQNGDVWVYTEIQSSEYGRLSNGQVFEVYVYFPAGVFSGMGVKFINYRIEVTVSGLT